MRITIDLNEIKIPYSEVIALCLASYKRGVEQGYLIATDDATAVENELNILGIKTQDDAEEA